MVHQLARSKQWHTSLHELAQRTRWDPFHTNIESEFLRIQLRVLLLRLLVGGGGVCRFFLLLLGGRRVGVGRVAGWCVGLGWCGGRGVGGFVGRRVDIHVRFARILIIGAADVARRDCRRVLITIGGVGLIVVCLLVFLRAFLRVAAVAIAIVAAAAM